MEYSPRERFQMTLDHEQPDRPPVRIWLVPEMQRTLEEHFAARFGTKDIQEGLELDFRQVKPRPKQVSGLSARKSAPTPKLPDGIYQDTQTKPLSHIQTLDDVEAYQPEHHPDLFDYSAIYESCLEARPYVTIYGSGGLFDIVNGLGARGKGMEQLLCEIMTEDPVAMSLIDKHLDADFDFCRRGLEAGKGEIDVLFIGEDCGIQTGSLFPPAVFRRFFAPKMKRFVDLAHAYGAACMLHSCGSIRQLMPVFIEIGIDIIEAVQPEATGMDPEGLKRDFGENITFCGTLSLQRTLTHGTVDACRQEAEHRIRIMGKGGGFIFSPANSVTRDVPLENVLAAYEVALGKALI